MYAADWNVFDRVTVRKPFSEPNLFFYYEFPEPFAFQVLYANCSHTTSRTPFGFAKTCDVPCFHICRLSWMSHTDKFVTLRHIRSPPFFRPTQNHTVMFHHTQSAGLNTGNKNKYRNFSEGAKRMIQTFLQAFYYCVCYQVPTQWLWPNFSHTSKIFKSRGI